MHGWECLVPKVHSTFILREWCISMWGFIGVKKVGLSKWDGFFISKVGVAHGSEFWLFLSLNTIPPFTDKSALMVILKSSPLWMSVAEVPVILTAERTLWPGLWSPISRDRMLLVQKWTEYWIRPTRINKLNSETYLRYLGSQGLIPWDIILEVSMTNKWSQRTIQT